MLFFGYVVGLEAELGYFTLSELTATRSMVGLSVERDVYFEPCRLSQVKAPHRLVQGKAGEDD